MFYSEQNAQKTIDLLQKSIEIHDTTFRNVISKAYIIENQWSGNYNSIFWPKIGRESEKSGKFFWLKIGRNENFIKIIKS